MKRVHTLRDSCV